MHLGQKKKSLKNLGTVMQARLKQVSRLGCNRISKLKVIQIVTMSLGKILFVSLCGQLCLFGFSLKKTTSTILSEMVVILCIC